MQSLAIKYRPQTFTEVVEQSATKVILQQQLESGEIKNAYLFCGGAGTGKTTVARIFAREINKGLGSPIELDAASNNSVDDVRDIIQQAKTSSLDSEYKVFIMDEVHALSNQAWQALLKILEEPPAKSIFIMCTTDPQKIPNTILSRVQRYNFQRISTQAICERLNEVVAREIENGSQIRVTDEGIAYIAKLASGGMRDALTMLDKCLAFSNDLTIREIVNALGLSDFTSMINLLKACVTEDSLTEIGVIREIYMSGLDLKQYVKDFTNFVLDYNKWLLGVDDYLDCPLTSEIEGAFEFAQEENLNGTELLSSLIKLQTEIKWDTNPLARVEAWCFAKE